MAAPAEKHPTPEQEQFAEGFRKIMRAHYAAHSEGTNVNRETLLTTDYLNHYNEVIMMLELMPTAPEEFLIYLMAWQPKSYEEHFAGTGFPEKDLAISAYRHAPEDIREAFDAVIGELQNEAVGALTQIHCLAEEGRVNAVSKMCNDVVPRMRTLVDNAAAIVNGGNETGKGEDGSKATCSQNDIDGLFS